VTYLDALAYDAPGVSITKVVFEINDQVVATATPTYYGWLAQWNTASVASGIYDLVSVATDANGNTLTSFPMTILVENPMPTTAVLIPSSGAILSGGSSVLDATASSPAGPSGRSSAQPRRPSTAISSSGTALLSRTARTLFRAS
jgi:hypothetical protein